MATSAEYLPQIIKFENFGLTNGTFIHSVFTCAAIVYGDCVHLAHGGIIQIAAAR